MVTLIGTEEISPIQRYPVVAIGNFDGIHLGHQAILKKTIERARANHGTSVVLTFRPHPSQILAPEKPTLLLTPFEDKIRLMESFGIDMVLLVEFNKEFSHQTPAEFAQDLLHEKIGCKEVIVGEKFAFGKNRAGTVTDLSRFGQKLGFTVFVQQNLTLNGAIVSSSRIRALLQEGNIGVAAKMLSRPYTMSGEVVPSEGRGRKMGFPTANINLSGKLVPKEGIYAARATFSDDPTLRNGIAYIGSKPTFTRQGAAQVEIHLFDFHKNIYGKKMEVSLLEWIRADEKFDSPEALIKQMQKDIKKARSILSLSG